MVRLFVALGTLSPLVARRWVPVHAGTELFKCQCEVLPRAPSRRETLQILKCHSPHEAINFVFVYFTSIVVGIDLLKIRFVLPIN